MKNGPLARACNSRVIAEDCPRSAQSCICLYIYMLATPRLIDVYLFSDVFLSASFFLSLSLSLFIHLFLFIRDRATMIICTSIRICLVFVYVQECTARDPFRLR